MNIFKNLFRKILIDDKHKVYWRALATTLAGVVVFVTTYSLILPAITMDSEVAEDMPGIYMDEDVEFVDVVPDTVDDPEDEAWSSDYSGVTEEGDTVTADQEWDSDAIIDDEEYGDESDCGKSVSGLQEEFLSFTVRELTQEIENETTKDKIKVRLSFDETASIPDGTRLEAFDISEAENESEYDPYVTASEDALRSDDSSWSDYSIRLFALSLLYGDEKVLPEDRVSVELQFTPHITSEKCKVLCFDDIDLEQYTDEVPLPSVLEDTSEEIFYKHAEDGSIEQITFDADSFCMIGIAEEKIEDSVAVSEDTQLKNAENAYESEETEGIFASGAETLAAMDHADASIEKRETEVETETEEAFPAQEFFGSTETVRVQVAADEGAFPAGTIMVLKDVEDDITLSAIEDVAIEDASKNMDSGRAKVSSVHAVDITFLDVEGNEIEPKQPIRVFMTPAEMAEEKESSPVIVHVDNDGNAETVDVLSEESLLETVNTEQESAADTADALSGTETVAFEADAFSVYALVYTVDFHWEVDGKTFDFNISGGECASFAKLVEALGLSKSGAYEEGLQLKDIVVSGETWDFLADVENVEFSSPELIWVGKAENDTTVGSIKEVNGLECQYSSELTEEQIETINKTEVQAGDWALISILPFATEECLTVSMMDGESFTIRVTDAQLKKTVLSASGKTYEITVTYGEDAKIPEGAQLKVREILPEDEAYNVLRSGIEEKLSDSDEKEPVNPVLFEISICDGEEEIEPAEGSEVRVEIKLIREALKGIFTDEATPILINEEPLQQENGSIEQNLQVIHYTQEDEIAVMDTFDTISDEETVSVFNTDSFSNWLVYLDEEVDTITIGKNDTITLRPYNQWSWKGDQGDTWAAPNTNGCGNVETKAIDDTLIGEKYTIYTITALQTGSFDVRTEGGKTIHVIVQENGVQDPPPTVSTIDNAENGITFNLFDYDQNHLLDESSNKAEYWSNSTTNNPSTDNNFQANMPAHNNDPNYNYEITVNAGHSLKFLGWGYSGAANDSWGSWTNGILDYVGSTAKQGIVSPDLDDDKFPTLKNFGKESLDYLFDTSATWENTGGAVQAYPNANGLFQKGSNGYYYYNSNSNYARYNENSNTFDVYQHTYQQKTEKNDTGNGKPIGFLPFHDYNPDDYIMNHNKVLNHHFGMDMAVEFSIPADGLDEFGNPITFEFSGDDDLWVFIDDKLVLDVGGIHQPVTASINFSNDVVKVYGKDDTTIQDMFNQSETDNKTWTKGDDVPHTMRVFYMERGGCDSNLSIRFNLPTKLGKGNFKVVKRDDNENRPLQNAKFGLWDNERCEGDPIREIISDENGNVDFGELSIASSDSAYYLREIEAPDDYIHDTGVYQVKPVLDDQGKVVKDGEYVRLQVVGPDNTVLERLENGAVVFPNSKIEKLSIPVQKIWTNDVITEGANITLTIKRYKLVEKTKGFLVVQDFEGKPDNYRFEADYTITYPDGNVVNIDYSQLKAGIYHVPDADPGQYTVVQNIRSSAPDNYSMTNTPEGLTRTVTLAEDGSVIAEFKSTFAPKMGTLDLRAVLNANGANVDFAGVRYAIIDSTGKKVASVTYDAIRNGLQIPLQTGTYSVKAVNVPADPSGFSGTHTVTYNNGEPKQGTALGGIEITENGTSTVEFNSTYQTTYATNCVFRIVDMYYDNYGEVVYDTVNMDNYMEGTVVTVEVHVDRSKAYLDNGNEPTVEPNDGTVSYTRSDDYSNNGRNWRKYLVTFPVISNTTPTFKINGVATNNVKDRENTVNRGYHPRNPEPSRSLSMSRRTALRGAGDSGETISMDNEASMPQAPEHMKYVSDDDWSKTVVLANGNNWIDTTTLANLDACDEEGNHYYYYVSHVEETGLEQVTTCAFGEGENGELLMVGTDKNVGASLSVTNTVNRLGALELTKIVTVNGADNTTNLTDGDYIFSIVGNESANSNENHTVKIHFTNGRASFYTIDDEVTTVLGTTNAWSVIIPGLRAGIYTVTETNQPANMSLTSVTGGNNNGNVNTKTITATVVAGDAVPDSESAKVRFTNNREERVTVTVKKKWEPEPDPEENASVTVELHRYAKKSTGVINVTLKDDNGAVIQGAVFKLYKDGQPTETTVTTDLNGRAGVSNLEGGHGYKLVQVSTPRAYSMGTGTVETDVLEVEEGVTRKQELNAELENTALVTEATVVLTLTDSGEGNGTAGQGIEGGTFTLYKDGAVYNEGYSTDGDGKISLSLGVGSYQFVQTGTAEAYKLPDNTVLDTFTVEDKPWEEQNFNLTMANSLKGKGTVTVNLVRKEDNTPISGAVFQLKKGDQLIEYGTTDANGQIVFGNSVPVYEGTYTVHQVDTGDAGSGYETSDDQNITIVPDSTVNQQKTVTFENESTIGNVTIKLWKKHGTDQYNWVEVKTYNDLKAGQTYSFTSIMDSSLYPKHAWLYIDDQDHEDTDSLDSTKLTSLAASGWNNGTYGFTFTPAEDNKTYSIVLVTDWGYDAIYSMSMDAQSNLTMSAASSPLTDESDEKYSTVNKLSVRRTAGDALIPLRGTFTDASPAAAPDGYMEDASFIPVSATIDASPWEHTFPPQDKYDANGDLYYYYVVETSWQPEDYKIDSYAGDPVSGSDGSITITNKRILKGDLELAKEIDGDGADPDMEFTFNVNLTFPEAAPSDMSFTTKIGETASTPVNLAADEQFASVTVTLKAGEKWIVEDLPDGTAYAITENDYSSFGYSAETTKGSLNGTITGGTSSKAEVEVTNTFNAGGLTVEKIIGGNAANPEKNFSFKVTITRPNNASGNHGQYKIGDTVHQIAFSGGKAEVSFTLKGGQQAEFSNLQIGSTFIVEEESADRDGYETEVTSTGGTVLAGAKTVIGTVQRKTNVTAAYTNTRNVTTADAVKLWKSGTQNIDWPADVQNVEFTLFAKVGSSGEWVAINDQSVASYFTGTEIDAVKVISKNTELRKAEWTDLPTRVITTPAVSADSENPDEASAAVWSDVTYLVKETKIVYTDSSEELVSIAASQGTITNEVEKVQIHASKQWKDKNGNLLDGTAGKEIPAGVQVTFTLVKDNVVDGAHTVVLNGVDETKNPQTGESVTPQSTDYEGADWAAHFTNLPKYTDEGNLIVYKVKETVTWRGYEIEGENLVENESIIVNKESSVDIHILKVDKDEGTRLTGAKFVLSRYDEGYHTPVETWVEQPVNEEGTLTFNKLAIGYYELKETESPTGYVKTSSNPRFEVKADANGELIVDFTNTNMVTYNSDDMTFTVRNERGAALPSTGGPGTRLFTILGSILAAGAGLLLWRRRRLILQ